MQLQEINSDFRFSGIYRWTNTVNGKVYIGQSQDVYVRFNDYKKGKFNTHMKNAIQQYGIESFSIDVLERDVPLEKLDEREQFWMDFYQSYNPQFGYNICCEAGTLRGFKHSEEVKQKMSQRMSGRTGEQHPMFGKHHSCETRQRMSVSHSNVPTGRTISKEQQQKMQAGAQKTVWKSVAKIDVLTGQVLEVYPSLREAARKHSCNKEGIRRCCVGLQQQFKGFLWSYINNA